MMNSVLGLSPRKILSFGLIVCSALAIWKSLMVVTNNKSPIVVVLSGSMEPAFYRGDLLFLYNDGGKYNVGDIVVFELKGKEIPIVHRIIKVHEDNDGRTRLLTKGDNNAVDDRGLYIRGQSWLDPEDVIGTVHGYLPYVGVVTILMNDYPMLKFGLIGVLALFVVFDRNQAT